VHQVVILRLSDYEYKEECVEECNFEDYIYDVSTTQLSEGFARYLTQFPKYRETNKYLTFTLYNKTFDYTTIAYHGKVSLLLIFLHNFKLDHVISLHYF
jgi:hypothetical protein